MLDYREGAKIGSLCANCGKKVPATLTNETLSLCKGLEEVENALVLVCDECGNMTGIPARSLPPIQQAIKRIIESGTVSDSNKITTELKSIMDARVEFAEKTEPDYQENYHD